MDHEDRGLGKAGGDLGDAKRMGALKIVRPAVQREHHPSRRDLLDDRQTDFRIVDEIDVARAVELDAAEAVIGTARQFVEGVLLNPGAD